jgi:hypothetical protein
MGTQTGSTTRCGTKGTWTMSKQASCCYHAVIAEYKIMCGCDKSQMIGAMAQAISDLRKEVTRLKGEDDD